MEENRDKGPIQTYVGYLKDNPNRYWFRRKLFGWGWTPATWEGWLTLLVFVVAMVWNATRIDNASHSVSDTLLNLLPQTVVLVAILIGVCFWKGEPPKWQWGIPKKEENREG